MGTVAFYNPFTARIFWLVSAFLVVVSAAAAAASDARPRYSSQQRRVLSSKSDKSSSSSKNGKKAKIGKKSKISIPTPTPTSCDTDILQIRVAAYGVAVSQERVDAVTTAIQGTYQGLSGGTVAFGSLRADVLTPDTEDYEFVLEAEDNTCTPLRFNDGTSADLTNYPCYTADTVVGARTYCVLSATLGSSSRSADAGIPDACRNLVASDSNIDPTDASLVCYDVSTTCCSSDTFIRN